MLSYGPCQFPTLGFIVERYQAVANFKSESFWYIKAEVERNINGKSTICEFRWVRDKLFDKSIVQLLLDNCKDAK